VPKTTVGNRVTTARAVKIADTGINESVFTKSSLISKKPGVYSTELLVKVLKVKPRKALQQYSQHY
jgi:hypothetical protein